MVVTWSTTSQSVPACSRRRAKSRAVIIVPPSLRRSAVRADQPSRVVLYLLVCTMHRMSTSDRLVETTRELLWERGYVGTSPKAIQQRSGVGQGSMYHHFGGKPDLALA